MVKKGVWEELISKPTPEMKRMTGRGVLLEENKGKRHGAYRQVPIGMGIQFSPRFVLRAALGK